MQPLLALLFVFLVGCTCRSEPGPQTPSTSDVPDDPPHYTGYTTDSGEPCWTSVVSTMPEDRAEGVFNKTTVRVKLSDLDPSATLSVAESGGSEVEGTTTASVETFLNDEYTVLAWTGEPLIPETLYTVTVEYKCGPEEFEWTTSDVGVPVETDLTGHTYAVDVGDGFWVEPVGVGPLFGVLISHYRLLIEVTDASDPATIDIRTAIALNGDQNECSPSVDLLDAVWSDPYFEFGIPYVEIVTDNFVAKITDFGLTGAFAPDGTRIEGAVLTGQLDTRELGEAMELDDTPNAVCDLIDNFGAVCVACAVDGLPYCVDVLVENVTGPEIGRDIDIITEADVNANEECLPP